MSLATTPLVPPAPPAVLGVTPIGTTFVAEVTGLRIAGDVDDASFAAYLDALHRHRVLLVRGVPRDDAALVAFSRRMGPLELHSEQRFTSREHPEIFCVGNYTENGEPRAHFARGIEQWHADSSFRAVPSMASLFYGAICPPEGGETWFIDAVAAYDDLPAATKARIDGLTAVHSLETLSEWSRGHNPHRAPMSDETKRKFPPMPQPLVRTHPVTGARSLFLCPAVISHIVGMDVAEGRALIDELMAHASQDRYVYRHRWTDGDLVVWDNRCTLHTATLFDHERYTRLMLRTTVAGTA